MLRAAYLLCCALLCLAPAARGQSADTLRLRFPETDSAHLSGMGLAWKSLHPNELAMREELGLLLRQLQARAHAEAALDSLARVPGGYMAYLHIGPAYRWCHLRLGRLPPAMLRRADFDERRFAEGKAFDFQDIIALQERLLDYAENHGYPFAKVWLDSVRIGAGGEVAARLEADLGRFISFDGVQLIESELKLSPRYLAQYLGLRPGTPYSYAKVLALRGRLRELPFVKESRSATVTFTDTRAIVNLFLQKQRSSQFDIIAGFLPNNGETQRLRITGTGKLLLYNSLGAGERIQAEFQQLRPETQELKLAFNYPYLLDLPFGADGRFGLYKRDTSYLDLEYDAGLQYLFAGDDVLRVFWNQRNSSLLSPNLVQIRQTRRLPDVLDLRYGSLGAAYQVRRTDYRPNPRQGWALHLRGTAGLRRVLPNNAIVQLSDPAEPGFDFASLYDTLPARSLQYRLLLEADYFVPLAKRSVLRFGLNAASILPLGDGLRNEQFRIGGNRLLRGFDEEAIFATQYAVGTLEYRFIIGLNAYFLLFADAAFVDDFTRERRRQDWPYGLGAGMSFETAAGLFSISYAYGAQQGQGIDLGAGKIHFGYVSLF